MKVLFYRVVLLGNRHAPWLLALCCSIATTLLVLSVGHNALQQEGRAAARLVEQRLTGVLAGLQGSATPRLLALRHDCDAFVDEARRLVLRNPYVRSVSLADAGQRTLTCSSITGHQQLQLGQGQRVPPLIYLPNSPLVPGTSTLVWHYLHADARLFYGMNLLMLRAIFPEHQDYLQVYIQVGRYRLTGNGLLPRGGEPVAVSSNRYFSTGFAYDSGGLLRYTLYHYLGYWLLLQAFSLLIYRLVCRQQTGEARMRRDIAQGLSRQQFSAYIQPVFSREGGLCGGEVLIRWRHHRRGFIPPDSFIAVAESSGQINRLFQVLLQQVNTMLNQAGVRLPPGFQLGLNICAQQLLDDGLLQGCRQLQARLQQCGGELMLELTERASLPDDERCYRVLEQLKQLGIRMAMDDFGTGHSSLVYLTRMQVDCIKIDRSFVSQLRQGQPGDIVANVIDLARRLGMATVAEGVETAYQHCRLVEMGVDRLQGYHFARPMPLQEFVDCYLQPLAGSETNATQVPATASPEAGA